MKAENNPFRSAAVAKLRFRLDPSEVRAMVEGLRANDWRGCILGPEGTGKTTLLEDLETPAQAAGVTIEWIRLSLDSDAEERRLAVDRIDRMNAEQCCFFDGGEVLGWLGWRRLLRTVRNRGCGLVATVHRPCPLPVVHRTAPDLEETVSLARHLADSHWSDELEAAARTAFRHSHGNAREVFRACYWCCATRADKMTPGKAHSPALRSLKPAPEHLPAPKTDLLSSNYDIDQKHH